MGKEKIVVTYREPLPAEDTSATLAGIAVADITPPPGMPTAGYAIASCNCYGFRTKLKARIFYLKPKKGRPVTLVQCDLLSGSLLLHHLVANLIARETDVDSAGMAFCATHTHSGPGNFFESEMYNANASNKPGLEKEYLSFCARQIADGVIKAYKERKPAKIATGSTEIWDVTVNRSLEPYLQNENLKKAKEKPDALKAVNPQLHMIRIDTKNNRGKFEPAGLFTNFSLHPNTCPSELGAVYSGDITGFFSRAVEKGLQEKYQTAVKPVHGAANYNHGDCNANHDQCRVENFRDLRNLAEKMAEKTLELFYNLDGKLKDNVKIGYRTRELSVLEEREAGDITISERGYAGMSLPAGARGRGRTTVFDKIPHFFRPGRPKKLNSNSLQGEKRIIGGPLQQLILPTSAMPHIYFLQVIQVHDTVLIPLPWEVTQEIGRRIGEKARELGEEAGLKGVKRFIVTDTSNGYFGYVTTPEEYAVQYYEGGSNLYGPNMGPYLTRKVGETVAVMAKEGSGGKVFDSLELNLTTKSYLPKNTEESGERKIFKNPRFYALPASDESYWSFQWYDVSPAKIQFHKPLVAIEVSEDGEKWETLLDGHEPVNDDGADIAVIYTRKNSSEKMGLYESRWFNPPNDYRYYRFKIYPRANQPIFYSPPMQMKIKKVG